MAVEEVMQTVHIDGLRYIPDDIGSKIIGPSIEKKEPPEMFFVNKYLTIRKSEYEEKYESEFYSHKSWNGRIRL